MEYTHFVIYLVFLQVLIICFFLLKLQGVYQFVTSLEVVE